MPLFETSLVLARPVAEVFDFLARPANLVRCTPPELSMQVVEGPERLRLGARLTLQARRWGIQQTIVREITHFEPDGCFVEEQRQGPFSHWAHTRHFEAVPGGCRLTDRIKFEPPGGMLGLLVNAETIERDLRWIFDYGRVKLEAQFGRLAEAS
jgi:ligand-binding SRPBCC domain-containing protein